jgi:competence protein ComEC
VNPKWVRQEAAARGIAVREILDAQVPAGPDSQGLTDADIDPFACAECDPQIAVLAGRLTENPGWNQEEFDNKNNQSIVVRVAFGSTVFLFTGDAEEPELELLAARYAANKLLDADVWHVGHHGSQNATTAPLLALVTPWIAVISMGAWDYGKEGKFRFTTWYYGHPRKQTIDLLAAKLPYARQKTITAKVADKSKTFRSVRILKAIYGTAWDGTVKVSATDDSKFVVATQK